MRQHDKAREFWRWFEQNRARIEQVHAELINNSFAPEAEAVIHEITAALKAVDKRIGPYGSVADDGVNDLVITANGDAGTFPTIFELVRVAPKVENWRFTPLRPREQVGAQICSTNVSLNCAQLRFHLEWAAAAPTLLLLAGEDVDATLMLWEEYQCLGATLVMAVLGELDFATRVGRTVVVNADRFQAQTGHNGKPFAQLTAEFPTQLSQ